MPKSYSITVIRVNVICYFTPRWSIWSSYVWIADVLWEPTQKHDSKTRGKFKARLTRIQVGTQKVKNSQAEESKKRGKRLGRKTGSGSQQKATRETLRNKAQEELGIHERKHTKYSKTKETQMQHIRVGQVITQEGNTEEQEDELETETKGWVSK